MDGFVIRRAEARDDVAVGELLIESFVTMYARKMPEVIVSENRKHELRQTASRRENGLVWVAELEGKIVGSVVLWPWGAKESEAFVEGAMDLRQLAVSESARGKGISAALCDVVEQYARAQGAPGVCLHARHGAVGVHGLYEKRGYQRRPDGDLDFRPEVLLDAYYLPFNR